MDTWDCWPCPICTALVCSMPVLSTHDDSQVCYILHIATCHPELYKL